MPFPVLARKVKQQFLQLKQLLAGRGFAKFKRLYRIKGELGQGGFGVVYRAVRLADGLPVAVKFIERRHVREWARLEEQRVPMEICMLARCANVPGVIGLLDWFALPEGFLLVMERPTPCVDLFDFIHRQKCLPECLARFLFRQVVQAVSDCAERRVLHRDLKDENVLLELATGRVRLIDFGAATLLMNRSRFQDFQGTRLYCPPEWFLHSLYLGREAAVWSLGVLLYNMLNGRLPFLNEKDICTAHLLGPLPFFAPLSRDARELLNSCLSFDPFARPSLAALLAHPWLLAKSSPAEWTQLSTECTALEGGTALLDGEEAGELHEQQHHHESGLASGGGECCSESPGVSLLASKAAPKITQAPTTAIPSQQRSLGIRRNAKTTNLGWQDGVDKTGGNEPDAVEMDACCYSISRPALRQYDLDPSKQKGTGNAAGSLDSGTGLDSPRSALPNETPFPVFC